MAGPWGDPNDQNRWKTLGKQPFRRLHGVSAGRVNKRKQASEQNKHQAPPQGIGSGPTGPGYQNEN